MRVTSLSSCPTLSDPTRIRFRRASRKCDQHRYLLCRCCHHPFMRPGGRGQAMPGAQERAEAVGVLGRKSLGWSWGQRCFMLLFVVHRSFIPQSFQAKAFKFPFPTLVSCQWQVARLVLLTPSLEILGDEAPQSSASRAAQLTSPHLAWFGQGLHHDLTLVSALHILHPAHLESETRASSQDLGVELSLSRRPQLAAGGVKGLWRLLALCSVATVDEATWRATQGKPEAVKELVPKQTGGILWRGVKLKWGIQTFALLELFGQLTVQANVHV